MKNLCNTFLKKYVEFKNKLLASAYGEAHYINGPETLPSPLGEEEEAQIISLLETDQHDRAKDILIEKNLRLVVYIAKRFENSYPGLEDLVSIGTIGLVKAINTFRSDKNIKLATYASRCIENEILMFLRKNSQSKNNISLDEPLNVDWDGNELLLSDVLGTDSDSVHKRIEEEEEKNILLSAVNKLPKRDRCIIEMRFGIGLAQSKEKTQKEVADILGISQSYISRLEKKIISNLKKQIISFYL